MARVPKTSTISNPKRKGYDVVLDDLLFRAAIGPGREMTISTAEFPNQQINTKSNPEDITTNIGQIFSRSNFSGGQGLDAAHRRNAKEDDVVRFFDSKGVDVFHGDDETSYHVHLLYTTTGQSLSFQSNNNYMTQTTNGHIYVTDEDNINHYNGTSWNTIDAAESGATHDFTGIAAFGNNLYATTQDGTSGSQLLYYDGSSWSVLTTAQSSAGGLTGVWYVKNRLWITGNDGTAEYVWEVNPFDTWDVTWLATADAIVEIEPTHSVTGIVDGGAAVLAASTDGTVYSFKLSSNVFVNQGQTKIPFEEVHSIAAAEGIIFIGTKEVARSVGRLYRLELVAADNLYVLANRQLIKEWVLATDTTPKTMFVSRDSVYMGIKEDTNEANLWRYYLPTGGLARDLQTSGNGFITGITQYDGKFFIVVTNSDVYKETSTYETEGYIITPNADFFTSEDKQWVGVEVEHDELSEGKAVNVYVSTVYDTIDDVNSSNWELVGQSVTGTGNVEYQLNRNARYINVKIVLESNVSNTESPKFRTVSVRALPRPELVVVTVPINLSDQVERPNRKSFRVKNLGEVIYQELKNKEGDSVTLQLFEPSEIIRGVVESVQYPISEKSEIGSVTQYCLIRVRGVRAEDASSLVTRLLGVGQLGVARLG
tara:strand:- start:177 stop:2135 length:1959 start_codon:yes stop_codon:yes gene_type:complete